MNLQLLLFRFRWMHAPSAILMMLLQRTPVLRVLTAQSPCFGLNAGDVLKSVFVLGAMGATNSVAGATTFNALAASPTTVTPASAAPNGSVTASGAQNAAFKVTFSCTGAPSTVKSWRVVNTTTFPAGLSVSNLTGTTTTLGTAVTNGYIVNGLSVIISGTPTAAGNSTLTVTAYDTAGSTSTQNAKVTCNVTITGSATAPAFTTQPSSQTVTAGANVTFTAAASGTPTPTYQWYQGTTLLTGQTSATLTLNNVQPANAGTYSVKATNSVSTVSSNNATLTVNTAPSFTTQPTSLSVNAGGNATFTAVVTGTPTPTFQWYKNSVAIPGMTTATLSLTNVQVANAAFYSVTATNSVASVSSSNATLTVNTAPVFTTQPITQTATVGATVTFTAAASGIPTPTYQWYQGTTLLTGQTNATLALTNVQVANAGSYSVLAINSVSPSGVSSNTATLTVNTALQSWRQLYFGTTANTGIAADTAISNLDGLPNLMEYALGGTPTVANGAIAPKMGTTVSSGSTYLTLTFTPQRADITYAIEVSANLGSTWTSIPLAGLLTMGKAYTYTDTVAAAVGVPRFLRLRVTGQ